MTNTQTILIVEDEKALSHALEIKLKEEGYNVFIADNGEAALENMKQNHIDIIVMDIIMPKMDGFTLLEMLQKESKTGKKIPTLVLSNLGQKEEIERAKNLGATEYLVKANAPFPTIIKMINKLLR